MKRDPGGGFATPITYVESIIGFFLVAIHMFATPPLLRVLSQSAGWNMSAETMTLVYFILSLILCVAFLFRFLGASFGPFFTRFGATVMTIILAFVAYYAILHIVQLVENLTAGRFVWPEIGGAGKLNHSSMLIVNLLLAPVVEEVLFRGVVFGVLRKKSRVLAYVVSLLLFSLYMVFWDMVSNLSWAVFWTALRCLPATLALCWSYERSGSVWTCVILHILMNCLGLLIIIV